MNVGPALPIAPARMEWQPGKATYCQKCRIPRPERSHHCSICGMCVLRMDHHCPWISNCVGFHNHKFFLLTGIYCCLACIVALVTSFPELVYCVAALLRLEAGYQWPAEDLQVVDVVVFLIFGALALIFLSLLAPMIASHLPLAQRNQTTIENHYINMPNPFDQGSSNSNLAQVFGAFGIDWFLPIKPFRPLSDGVSYARFDERLSISGFPELPESLMGDQDEPELERLWRLRYHVRPPVVARVEKKEEDGPLPFLARWWNGSPEPSTRRIISL